MFDGPGPHLFALSPGVDFPALLVDGLCARLSGQPPEAMARVTVFLNTERMRRRVRTLFQAQGPMILPRLRLVTDLGRDTALPGLPAAVPPLRRRLQIAQLVSALLDRDPSIAPRTALFDLAESLAGLLDEMQGEGVAPEAIARLDVSEHSAHWARTQAFMGIVAPLFSADAAPDAEGRQRAAVEALAHTWRDAPPADPVVVAGSTGSRGTTLRLMEAVATLPQGAIVLPGFDFHSAAIDGGVLDDALTGEDHPQFRFHRLLATLGCGPEAIKVWRDLPPPAPARNRLISLSLRPAPVTDCWISEGPNLGSLTKAVDGMTLIEAPSPRAEAQAIALILRDAAEGTGTAALITPDRTLSRQVTAALDRWGIRPDDSAGRPLALSAPGRLLRQVAGLFGTRLTAEVLLALLKHPLVASGGDRGTHLRLSRELELDLRRHGPVYPTPGDLRTWAEKREHPAWGQWLGTALEGAVSGDLPLAEHVSRHRAMTEHLSSGEGDVTAGGLWQAEAGEKALAVMDALAREAPHGGVMSAADYRSLLDGLLNAEDVREGIEAHPRIMIWGTLEARVQGADLVILGGLNEGIWPALPAADPWLNRRMRLDAGLLLPERRIGLSAHDYQQAVAAPRVVLARAIRNAEAQTVPSRWLNRLSNLLAGLPDQLGPKALEEMRARGNHWLALARTADVAPSLPAAHRPSPRPPLAARPRELSVTQVATLIRDPYAIYARKVLRLNPLDPLRANADARLRGSVLHKVLERYVMERPPSDPDPRTRLLDVTQRVLADIVPWPAARALWYARIARAGDFFLSLEARLGGIPVLIEQKGGADIGTDGFRLTARPDRIDLLPDGRVQVFDYKTGTPPTTKQQEQFDKQLLLTAALAEEGAFTELNGPRRVAAISYVGLGSAPVEVTTQMDADQIAAVWASFRRLMARYGKPDQGYTARRALFVDRYPQDYDHLARFGEWEMTDDPLPEDLT